MLYKKLTEVRSSFALFLLCLSLHLLQDLQKWPWAESRSWQSWRDRYVKHQDAFNISIKRYRKRAAMGKEDAVVTSGKRKHESDEGAASKRPKLVDHDKVQGDYQQMKDMVISMPLPPPTVAPQPAAKQVTARRVHSDSGEDSAREQTTVPQEASKTKTSTTRTAASLFTQVSDEEPDYRETPGPDDYTGEIFSDDPQEHVDEQVMDAQMAVESDHDPTDVSEVEELLTPSRSKIAAMSYALSF